MIHYWNQANSYAKFIIVLAFVYPLCMLYLAWRIEKMYKSYQERQKEKAPLAATK